MTGDIAYRNFRIGLYQSPHDAAQNFVLPVIIGRFVITLEFDAYRKIVALRTAAKTRLARMPGTLVKGHELQYAAIPANQQMRRNLHPPNFGKVRMSAPVELVQKQSLDLGSAELAGRQADPVQYDHAWRHTLRAGISVRTQTQATRLDKPGFRADGIFASHHWFRHDFNLMSTRLFVSGALINGVEIELDGDRARYLGTVLRMHVGDGLIVFNGEGPEWPATVTRIGRNSVGLTLGESVEAGTESPLKIHLVQAISRGERMDFIVQKATELGVKRITPVLTEYGIVKLNAERAQKRRDHWQKIAASACEQSGRTRLPLIDTPLPLKNWFGNKPARVDAELILRPGSTLALAALSAPKTKVCVLIGPDGGFSDIEYEDAEIAGFTPMSLGPRILRTESAAIATLAILQSLWGDLR